MVIDDTGLAHLRAFEGFREIAYWDRSGWACGYGHHGPEISQTTICTKEEAENWLQADTLILSHRISSLLNQNIQLNQGQFNVLVIFTYNVGIGAFAASELRKRLNSCEFDCIVSELNRWVYSNHKVDPGLVARRIAEAKLWKEATQIAA